MDHEQRSEGSAKLIRRTECLWSFVSLALMSRRGPAKDIRFRMESIVCGRYHHWRPSVLAARAPLVILYLTGPTLPSRAGSE